MARLGRVQMVEGRKECPESVEMLRDPRGVDRVPEEMNAIGGRRREIVKLSFARIFVR
jgi:hypothetical protein